MISAPTALVPTHTLHSFKCGNPSLDEWLTRRAFANHNNGASRVYVVCLDSYVIGYYALAVGSASSSEAPGKIKRNMPDPIPVMVLGKLAIDERWQGKGIGKDLLQDAVLRAMQAAEIGGIRAMLVDAIDNKAAEFYERSGFLVSPIKPLKLFLPLYPLLKTT